MASAAALPSAASCQWPWADGVALCVLGSVRKAGDKQQVEHFKVCMQWRTYKTVRMCMYRLGCWTQQARQASTKVQSAMPFIQPSTS